MVVAPPTDRSGTTAAPAPESVRAFYRGWYNELVTVIPRIEDGYVYPMEGPGLGVDLLPAVFERPDLTVRTSRV